MRTKNTRRQELDRPGTSSLLTRRSILAAGSAALLTLAGPAGVAHAQSTPTSSSEPVLTIPLYPHGADIALDPHRAANWGPHWVLLPHVWSGLMGFDENGTVVPVLASALEPEDDGRVWVASIRSEATFASGNPVTAGALIEGWRRALDPLRLSPMSGYMRQVQGVDAFIAREETELGFEARDEATVAIHLVEPNATFPEDLATFVWAAIDVSVLDGVPIDEVPFAGASAGAWQFVATDDPSIIRMQPGAAGSNMPSTFTTVDWALVTGPEAPSVALDSYRTGALALADAPSTIRTEIVGDPALSEDLRTVEQSGSTLLIGMDFRQSPFDDLRVRRAVAAAIDRQHWATTIMQDTFVAATSISPPVLAVTANYVPPEPTAFNPEVARGLMEEAGISEDSMPQVTYFQPAGSSQVEIEQAMALLAMIEQNCGLVIEHDTSLTAQQIDARRRDNGGLQFDLRWWWPLTNSPSGIGQIGLPDSDAMAGWFNWSPALEDTEVAEAADQFATLIAESSATLDDTERQQLYAQAEAILVQLPVYIPLGHGVQAWVQSPGLTGTRQGAFTGYVPVAFDQDTVWQAPDTESG